MFRTPVCACRPWKRFQRATLPVLLVLSLGVSGCQNARWSPFHSWGGLPPAVPWTVPQTPSQTKESVSPRPDTGPPATRIPAETEDFLAETALTTLVPPSGAAVTEETGDLASGARQDGTASPASGIPAVHPRRVALLLPLSGGAANVGQTLLNSAQMALFEVSGPGLVLQVYDTKGTADGAVRAADLALHQGVRLIIGPLFSPEVKAVAPKTQGLNVNIVALTSDPATATKGVFILGHQLQQQVERVALFARSRGLTVFTALAPDDEQGRQAVQALRKAVTAADGLVTAVEFYDPASADLTPAVRRLAQQKPFDAVLIPDKGSRVKGVAPLLPYFDIDLQATRLLGTQRWADGDLRHEPAVVGGWYAAPFSPAQTRFIERYRRAFGANPSAIASLAYDAVALAAVLGRGISGPDFDNGAFTSAAGFAGVDGLFRLQPSGVAERGLAVMEVQADGTPVIVSPSPESFDRPGF